LLTDHESVSICHKNKQLIVIRVAEQYDRLVAFLRCLSASPVVWQMKVIEEFLDSV
jgi:hypothetical protein